MLYDLIIGSLEMLADTIEYGPVKAFEINTSFCPQAERETIRMNREFQKKKDKSPVYDSTEPEKEATDGRSQKIYGSNSIIQGVKLTCETGIDEAEEEMINQAVADKGHW